MEDVYSHVSKIVISLNSVSRGDRFSVVVPFDGHGQVALGFDARLEVGSLALDDLVRPLQGAQESRGLCHLGLLLELPRVSARIFQRLDLLQSGRVLTVVNNVVLAYHAQLSGCVSFTDAVVSATRVNTDVVNRYVFDGQCHVTKVEERRDP